jgi:eukaryotic-like serine/threonine-protein kinase
VKTKADGKRGLVDQGTAVLDKGTRLGEYEIERLLGVGAMGAVYEAVCTATDQRHAIKVLSPALAAVPTARARFLKEAELTARVRHPHIVSVSDVGEDAGRSYFVMELLSGEDLGHRLQRSGTLAIAEIVDIMLPVCDAVAEAHRRRVTHRDLKPSNIFLLVRGKRPHPVVLDFGIAEDEQASAGDAAGAPPARRAVFGTPYYLAPEQVADHQSAGPASDQYALGVILYECLTGHPPYRGSKVEEVFRAIAAGNPPPPSTRRPDIPPEVDAVVLRALSVDPKARFASVAELRQALQPFASSTSGAYKPIPSRLAIEAAKTRLGMSPAIEAEAKTRAPSSPAIDVGAKTRLGMSPAIEAETKTRAPSSPAIDVETKTPSPFVRTLTPEVEALDHAWFAAGDAAQESTGETAIPSTAGLELDAESSGAMVPPVAVDREASGMAPFASRRVWIGVAAGVAAASLALVLVAKRGNSAPRQAMPAPPAALAQVEPAAAKPPADTPPVAPEATPVAAAPAPAPDEAPTAAAPVPAPAPAPNEAPTAAAPVPTPAPSEAPAPVVLTSAPSEAPVAAPAEPPPVAAAEPPAAAPREPSTATRSRARKSADRPRARSGVRMHNGVPLLD